MSLPRVSVCITTYNHERYIRDCIMSVVAQAQDVPLEILVGDDQSSDCTEEIVHTLAMRFPDIIRYFRHKNRLGAERNYKYLIDKAEGDYIANLDGDDYWLPGKLAKQVLLMDRMTEMSACYTNALCIDDRGEAIGIFNNPQPNELDIDYLLTRGNFLNNSSMLYRSRMKPVICDGPPKLVDYSIHIMLALQGKIGYLNTLGVVYRVNSSTSIIVHQGENIRELYWQAISEVSTKDKIPSNCRLSASADFLRRIFFKSVRLRSLNLVRKWWPIVSVANEHHKKKLVLLAMWSILVVGCREIMSHMAARLGGTRLRVIYWR